MNHEKAFHALQVLTQTPRTRAWLEMNDPQALAQALLALAPAAGDAVTVKTTILTETMDNLATLMGPKSFTVDACTVDGRGFVNCLMRGESESEVAVRVTVLAKFVRTFVHPNARVVDGGGDGADGPSVLIVVDQNTA